PPGLWWPQRPCLQAEGFGTLGGGEVFSPGEVRGGHFGEQDIAARRVETAGERIEHRNRPASLGRVRMLIDARPDVIGHWTRGEEELRGLPHLVSGHPGNCLDDVWGVVLAEGRIEVKRRAAL